jgi:hypothetical protein
VYKIEWWLSRGVPPGVTVMLKSLRPEGFRRVNFTPALVRGAARTVKASVAAKDK